jgi:Hom_end-associated Hint
MFISGEGGTGKSFIIALIRAFTRLRYGKQLGLFGSIATIAPTGCAAILVECQTWQASYGVGKNCDQNGKNILMYNGTIKMVQNIVVGDIVMGDDSTPRNVTNAPFHFVCFFRS